MANSAKTSAPVRALVGLGANLGDRLATLRLALQAINQHPQCRLYACSSAYQTSPLDAEGPDYLNAVAIIETTLDAPSLLAFLHDIENTHGRRRESKNAPRTLDLDLLTYNNLHIESTTLTVPHPRMAARAFVLRPIVELQADFEFADQRRARDLLARIDAQGGQEIRRLSDPLWSQIR